jgi:hypothetical protein
MQTKLVSKSNAPGSTSTSRPATVEKANGKTAPSRNEIARRAYELHVARGQTSGHEMEDWIQAERELSGKALVNN